MDLKTDIITGPVVSAMTNKFGCRPVVVAGSCIATVAFVLATFSPNIEIMMLTYGVVGGKFEFRLSWENFVFKIDEDVH